MSSELAEQVANAGSKFDLVIEANNLPAVVDQAITYLIERNSGVYERGDVVVGFVGDEEMLSTGKSHRIVTLNDDSLAQRVNRCGVTTGRVNRKTGHAAAVNFPPAVARTILSEKRYCFPQLVSVVETPQLRKSGQVLAKPGYTADGVLLHFNPAEFNADEFTAAVTPDDVDAAVVWLRRLVKGFPFDGGISETVALSALMTAVMRASMNAAPGYAITARAPGSGKTYLQRLLSLIATGRDVGVNSWPDDEVEFRKLALSALLGGEAHFAVDNLNGVLRSDALCVILTAPLFQQRMLGLNETVSVPTRTLVSVTGNNLLLAGDLVRRFLVCGLDAGIERPERRTFASDPVRMLLAERASYVRAALTIARCYLERGTRPASMSPLAGFDEWSLFVREPLIWAGVGDPVASMDAAAELDPDRLQLAAMIEACSAAGIVEFDVAGLVGTARASHVLGDEAGNQKRSALKQAIEDIALRGGEVNNRALGRWLAGIEGRVCRGQRFVRKTDGRSALGVQWRIERV